VEEQKRSLRQRNHTNAAIDGGRAMLSCAKNRSLLHERIVIPTRVSCAIFTDVDRKLELAGLRKG